MDSTNFQHHQHQQQLQQQHQHQQQQQHLQEHFVGCSPLNNPPAYGVSTSLDWNPSFLSTSRTSSNSFNNKLYENEFHASGDSRALSRPPDSALSTAISPAINDNDARNFSYPASNQQLPKIEEDMLSSFPNFGGLIHNNTTTTGMENPACWFNGFASAGSGEHYGSRGLMQLPLDIKNHQLSSYNHNNSNGINSINNWSGHDFPSTTLLNQLGLVSSPNSTTTSISSSPRLGLNLQATDFMGNNGNHNRPLYDGAGEEVISPAGKVMSTKQATALMHGVVTGTKRAAGNCTSNQSKSSTSTHTAPTKKSQLKVSCPPFKVRKEKLGERIASLHQMVSPFGKTDTASVLTEAIGYIQFLQDQIHTLCMPHAKPSRNKPCRPLPMGPGTEDDGGEEARIDLQRRGLCLVPLSWTSYITPTQMDASNISYF